MAGAVVVAGVVVGRFAYRNLDTYDRHRAAVEKAGFVEKQATVNGVLFNYAEGPARPGAPALLIIPGQGSDWRSFGRVLPELTRDFHVFAVDVHGHGGTSRALGRYQARQVGADLREFLVQVVQQPAVVSGHSSGGQLAAWLAVNAPDQVRAVLLEDPPMLTTLLPRAKNTWNWQDLATSCHHFLAEHPDGKGDFVAYAWEHQLMWKYFGGGATGLKKAGLEQRRQHPDRPIRLWWFPGADFQRSLAAYDPHFGDAFYTGAWDEGFDHEATLRAIGQPTIYVHAKVDYDGDILRGAADDNDAHRITELLPNERFVQTATGHDVHNEVPREFIGWLRELKHRI